MLIVLSLRLVNMKSSSCFHAFMASLKFEEPFLIGCMFKCMFFGAFGAGPPKSLDLLGVGNPGKKRHLAIGTVSNLLYIKTA